jgi:hypothetical protein
MEKARFGYHGRVSALVKQEMATARLIKETHKEAKKPAIYWVRLEDVNEEVFNQVIDIYSLVFNRSGVEFVRPNVSELSEAMSTIGSGYIDWHLLGNNITALEARRRIGLQGTQFIRFRTMPGGSTKIDDTPNPRRDDFQHRVDTLLIQKALAVRLEDTF